MDPHKFAALGRCGNCLKSFMFDPARVSTFLFDPQTGYPPDVDPDTKQPKEPDPEAVARSTKKPICPECIDRVNPERAKLGLDPIKHENENRPIF